MIYETLKKHDAQFYVQHAGDMNFYYATNFKLPDSAFYIIGIDGTDLLVVPEMEKNRALRESRVKEIASFTDIGYHDRLKELKDSKKAMAQTMIELLKSHGAKKVLLPPNFPAYLALAFSQHFEVEVVDNPFLKMRAVKSREEIEKIKEVSMAIVESFKFALELIKNGERDCDVLRSKLETFLFSKGYLAQDTIIASGRLSADPHFIGHGEIQEHVILDIFPKSRVHGYYSDFTRTVILDDCPEIEEMLDAVIEAQQRAISIIREGVTAKEVHHTVCDVLEERGYHTLRKKYREGFIHSTGHGVGLDIHEEPRIFENEDVLKAGMVFTVEPGLYYKKWGGVRVEDVVVVKKNGCEILTEYPRKIDLRKA
jgi:Xaa-Pro aminopeptidase